VTEEQRRHLKAVRMLAATTIFWSLSFPTVKAITILQNGLLPEHSSWFHASLTSLGRFGAAALVLFVISARTIRRLTRLELWQGLGLGGFAGGGILLQMDGLSHTSASTSAFVTQMFCVLVPLFVAVRLRALPGARVMGALLLMLSGVAILSNFDLKTFRLGRGETETLVAAFFFAGQILWLDRPLFARNNVNHFSVVMFATMALLSLPILIATTHSPRDIILCYSNGGVLALVAALTFFCTLIAFVYMNRWQPFVSATEAAIIYGAEPVFASTLALFLPAIISRATGIDYPNEKITTQLLLGGALILIANVVLQWKRQPRRIIVAE
jgi:drug/metabolite transporter (DMT)-like permease